MNKGELVSAIAEKTGMTKVASGEALDAVLESITEGLKAGEVRLPGFGSFYVSDRAAGVARNPRTGEEIKVAASKAPKFKAGAGLKQAVNG
jgi:DNA-binding protein HU-beta